MDVFLFNLNFGFPLYSKNDDPYRLCNADEQMTSTVLLLGYRPIFCNKKKTFFEIPNIS